MECRWDGTPARPAHRLRIEPFKVATLGCLAARRFLCRAARRAANQNERQAARQPRVASCEGSCRRLRAGRARVPVLPWSATSRIGSHIRTGASTTAGINASWEHSPGSGEFCVFHFSVPIVSVRIASSQFPAGARRATLSTLVHAPVLSGYQIAKWQRYFRRISFRLRADPRTSP